MKKRYLFGLGVIMICLFAVISNPTKEDYVSFVKEDVTEASHPIIGMVSGPFLNSLTTKKSYGIFTIYKTTFDDNKGEFVSAVGFLNNFFWIHHPQGS